jgi:hypothetical protein
MFYFHHATAACRQLIEKLADCTDMDECKQYRNTIKAVKTHKTAISFATEVVN